MSEPVFSDIFISHATEDEGVARAWRYLIQGITGDAVKPWFTGCEDPGGGVTAGDDWRRSLTQALEHAKTILVMLTPGSNERPWVHYEVGFASGQKKRIIPILHFMEKDHVNELFQSIMPQAIMGRKKDEVFKMLKDVVLAGEAVSPVREEGWEAYFNKFDKMLVQEAIAAVTRTHFRDHFHKAQTAKQLSGTWKAQWTQVHEDGREEPFEADALYVWTTDCRVRMVGLNQKLGLAQKQETEPEYRVYPMEGVVSSESWIALSYWSAGTIPICGTCLLKPKGSTGRRLVGTWEGFTARSIEDDSAYTRGKVEMTKIDDVMIPMADLQQRLHAATATPA
jgi:hypothetical protein